MRKWLLLSGAVVVADQVSKLVATAWLSADVAVAVMPYMNLILVHNPGAAFSLLSEAGGWQRWGLSAVAVVVCLVLYHWLTQLERGETGSAVAVTAIIGGAVGNTIDRLAYGYVVDFIDLYYGEYHWPTFNVADMAITLGALTLILVVVRND